MRRSNGKPDIKTVIDRRQLILGTVTLVLMAVLMIVGLTPRTAAAPDEPDAAQAGSNTAVTLTADCEVVQHLTYTPCGHELTRRQTLPAELVGKTRTDAEAVYDQWQITSFAPDELRMEQALSMYCPEHVVLLPDESGMLCIFQNRYGDALALVRELQIPLADLPEALQEELRVGKGFPTVEDLERWLESAES